MATKTVVCPVCGSASAPGRFACSECGALLVAVAMSPRGRVSDALDGDIEPGSAEATGDSESSTVPIAAAAPMPAVRLRPRRRTSATLAAIDREPADEPGPADEPVVADAQAVAGLAPAVDRVEAVDEDDGPAEDDSAPFDENAPLAAAIRRPTQPAVLHDLPDEPEPTILSASAAPPLADPGVPIAPSWPPPGDRGPFAAPKPRVPAGAYLPPSAVLPPLDAPGAGSAAGPGSAGSPVAATAAGPDALAAAPGSASSADDWLGRASAALSDALGSVRVAADGSRRAVFAGAGLASLGILLPWVNTLPGASPLANYVERWGLAGPGMWFVFVGLLALAAVAAATGRPASWPVGLPAIVAAAFLAGVIWPYIIGGYGRSIGIWVVVVGALVLLVGGLLDHRAHHDRGDASV